MSIKKINRALYSDAKKYLDVKSMFPNSKNVGRNGLTEYQAKKIKRELKRLTALAGGAHYLERDFVKIRRTKSAREYMDDGVLPKHARGILLPGGEKINSGVTIKNGTVFFRRGLRESALFQLSAITEKSLEKSLKKYSKIINDENHISYIETSGGKITGISIKNKRDRWERHQIPGVAFDPEEEKTALDKITEIALMIYNKYADMAKAGEYRENGRIAANPSKWGMKLLIEKK